jgi:dipeptidyl aminopeptidase/acylaminoacyl peptidase
LAASLNRYAPVNATQLGIWGHSMGGHVALDAVTVAPKRFKAAVTASASIGTVDDMYYNWVPPSERANVDGQAEKKRIAALFGEPKQSPTFWAELSPLTYGADLKTPLQLHHGTADAVVPARFSQEANDALVVRGANVALYTYPKAGHLYTGADKALVIERSLSWYNQYLLP